MAKWTTSETGILRKKQQRENFDDLLVFGYACKLFRDDEKASYIDKGKHLIPWMGDEKLRIDRYDCRGALSELGICEASREGYDATRWLGLSESERKIEQLCDEERYYALHKNEDEEALYREEELKRLQQKTNEFHFNYDVQNETPSTESSNEDKPSTVEEDDRPYVPPPELDVPADITIPKTVKENARIVKTAHFISLQGSQMEILIKTKQSSNPQFGFMISTDPVYKYYRHVLQAIKNGTYKVDTSTNSDPNLDESADHDSDEHYLHPSLITTSAQSVLAPPTIIPTIPYRPSADCLYSQLVNRIQGSQLGESVPKPEVAPPPQNVSYDQQQQQYYQYYYTMQCYEYYKQMMQYQTQNYGQGEVTGGMDIQQIQEQLNSISQYLQQQHQHQQNPNNPYAQIVANLSQHTKDAPNPSFPAPTPPEPQKPNDITKAPVLYSKKETEPCPSTLIGPQLPEKPGNDTQKPELASPAPKKPEPEVKLSAKTPEVNDAIKPEEVLKKPLLSLVHYGSDSEDESSSSEEEKEALKTAPVNLKVPPEETQVIIDKMASYVAKNGGNFEEIVKSKGDPRFDFLNLEHEYHAYYKHKIGVFSGTVAPEKDQKSAIGDKEKNGLPAKVKEKKVIAPVCFSIKKAKDEPPKDIKSALPLEESDEEPEENVATTVPNTPVAKDTKPVVTTAHSTTIYSISNAPILISGSSTTPALSTGEISKTYVPASTPLNPDRIITVQDSAKTENIDIIDITEKCGAAHKNGSSDTDDPILEMIDLTYDLEERRDAKRAEDKIKDKLAAAAREKLASVARDRALQIERKKKAAAFLKLKSAECEPKSSEADDVCKETGDKSKESDAEKPYDVETHQSRHTSKSDPSKSAHPSSNDHKYKDSHRHKDHKRTKSKRSLEGPSSRRGHSEYYKSSRSRSREKRSSSQNKEQKRSKSRSVIREVHSRSRSRSHINSPRLKPNDKVSLQIIDETEEVITISDSRKASTSRSENHTESHSRECSRSKESSHQRKRRSSKSGEPTSKRPKHIEKDRKESLSSQSESSDVKLVSVYKLPDKNGATILDYERLTEREVEVKDDESGTEEGEIKKHKRSSKKKKSHKRNTSKSRHESKSHHKKSKKRRKSRSRSTSNSSSSP